MKSSGPHYTMDEGVLINPYPAFLPDVVGQNR